MSKGLAVKDARAGAFFRKPKYEKEETGHIIEVGAPDPEFFTELGYDRKPGSAEKHYRYCLKNSLEESDFMDKTPFNEYDLWRGQSRGNDSLFAVF